MMMSLYKIATYAAIPLLPFYMRMRLKRGKEDAGRIHERYGYNKTARPEHPLIWIHAASVGETNSVQRFIHHLLAHYPSLHIVLTTTTVTAASMIAQRHIERVHHAYAPIDTPPSVRRFLQHWQPDLACFVDSELWPNIIQSIKARSIPLILLNGRMSPRSAQRWRNAPRTCTKLLGAFTLIFAKSEEDAALFQSLGASSVHHVGNMKYDAYPLPVDDAHLEHMRASLGSRPCWVAASTHMGEEEQLALAHQQLRERYPDALLILVPRHAHRGNAIATMLRSHGWDVAQRSTQDPLSDSTSIYLADTMGELGLWYRLTEIAFMGGSLIPHGGQNPLEAMRLECAILYGPHRFNFADVCHDLQQAHALHDIEDARSLAYHLITLIEEAQTRHVLIASGNAFLAQHEDVIPQIHELLSPHLRYSGLTLWRIKDAQL